MPAAQPAHHAGGDIWIRQVHHCWRYDQDPRLRAHARIAVIDARKSGIAAVQRLPVRNAERCSTISPLIGCNAGGDAEQIRKTVNTGGLYAWVEHNPNFLRGACSLHHLSLAAKTLTLAAIETAEGTEAP